MFRIFLYILLSRCGNPLNWYPLVGGTHYKHLVPADERIIAVNLDYCIIIMYISYVGNVCDNLPYGAHYINVYNKIVDLSRVDFSSSLSIHNIFFSRLKYFLQTISVGGPPTACSPPDFNSKGSYVLFICIVYYIDGQGY